MGSYRRNLEERLERYEEMLEDENLDSLVWEKVVEKKMEVTDALKELDALEE